MGRFIRPDGTSAEVVEGLGVIAPRNPTAQPMARPTGNQIAPQLAAQRARADAEAQRRREADARARAEQAAADARRRACATPNPPAECIQAEAAGFGGQPADCGPDEYEVEGPYLNECAPMSDEDRAARDAAAARERTRQQQAEMEQRRRQRQAEQQQYQREQQQRRAIAAVTRATRAPLGVRPPARGR